VRPGSASGFGLLAIHLEAAAGFRIRHGDAVAMDLALSATVAMLLRLISPADCERIVVTIEAIGLPIASSLLSPELCSSALDDAVKHRGGRLNLPLPSAIGEARFVTSRADLPLQVLEEALAILGERAAAQAASRRQSFMSGASESASGISSRSNMPRTSSRANHRVSMTSLGSGATSSG